MSWNIGQRLGKIVATAVSISLGTYLLATATAIVLVALTPLGSQLLNTQARVPIELFLTLVIIRLPSNLFVVTLVSIAVFLVCFLVAFRQHDSFVADVKSLFSGRIPRRRANWMVVMPLLASTLLLVVLIITLLQDTAGLSSGSLYNPNSPPPDAALFGNLAYAPVAEEIGFRVTGLGIFVALIVLFLRPAVESSSAPRPVLSAALLSLVSPDLGKSFAGLPNVRDNGLTGIHWFEWLGLGVTSAFFGIAHLLGGADWGIGKVTTAALSGLALGFVYLVYGACASILLHWFFDFYLSVFQIGADFLGKTLFLFDDVLALFTLAVGVAGLGVAIILFIVRRTDGPPPEIPYMPDGTPNTFVKA